MIINPMNIGMLYPILKWKTRDDFIPVFLSFSLGKPTKTMISLISIVCFFLTSSTLLMGTLLGVSIDVFQNFFLAKGDVQNMY